MGQNFEPNRTADRVLQCWAPDGRDPGEPVRNFIHIWTNASGESTLQRKNLRKIRPCATASLGYHSSQLDVSPRWLETGSRKSKLLESPGVPELEEPLGGRRKIFPNRMPRGGLVLGSMTGFPVQGHLGAKSEHF